jgi:phospholipase D1/2
MGVDTECDIAIEAEHEGARDAIANLRNRLIAEHLCAKPEALEAAIAERGSVLGAIEHLNRNSRCLVPYAIEPRRKSWIFGRDLFDPARPLSFAGLWARFIAGWTTKARAS